MEPEKINPNISNSSQNTASSSGTSSQIKGKRKEVINVVESLDLIIENTEQSSINISSESQADLNSETAKDKLLWKKPEERQELAESFSGLDRILYNRLEKKAARLDRLKIHRTIAFNIFGKHVGERLRRMDFGFSPDEIKEIVNELGVSANVDTTEKLQQIKEAVMDREQGLSKRISDLETTINRYEQKEQEVRNRAADKIKKGRTLDSKAITELKQAKERIDELENEILELEQNRDDFKDLLDAQEIKTEAKQRELENAIEAAETLDTRLKTARAEKAEWEKKAKTSEGVIRLREQRITNLEREKAESEGGKLYQFTVWIGKKTGISDLWNVISNTAMIIGLLVILLGISWFWKYLIRPMIKNFTPEPKPNEPQPTPAAAINHNQPPIIIMPPQHQTPPTNHYQTLPPQEIKVIEVEPPKAVAGKVSSTPKKNSKKSKAIKKKPQNKK